MYPLVGSELAGLNRSTKSRSPLHPLPKLQHHKDRDAGHRRPYARRPVLRPLLLRQREEPPRHAQHHGPTWLTTWKKPRSRHAASSTASGGGGARPGQRQSSGDGGGCGERWRSSAGAGGAVEEPYLSIVLSCPVDADVNCFVRFLSP